MSSAAQGGGLAELAAELARLALGELRARQGRVSGTPKTAAGDLVSEADRVAEGALVAQLQRLRPDDGVLGEELGASPSHSGLTWVIDPLDGTVNYLRGSGPWGVSVAVRDQDGPLAGAVVVGPTGELFTAARGKGAALDGRALTLTPAPPPEAALVGTGFAYDRDARVAWARRLPDLVSRIADVRRSGAAAIDLCLVAAGRLDGFIHLGLPAWDFTAGMLIAAESGRCAEVAWLTEDRADVLCCHPALLGTLQQAVGDLFPLARRPGRAEPTGADIKGER